MKEISVDEAVNIINNGGIIIFPTDTAFGVGCRIDKERSIERLFRIRRRPLEKAMPVLVSGMEMAEKYLSPLSDIVRQLMRIYWPGALTVVYKCNVNLVPFRVRGGGSTLGVRMPKHSTVLKLIKKVGVPILGPSANFHNEPTPYHFKDLNSDFVNLTDGVIKGLTHQNNVSTVIDCTRRPFTIIRQGALIVDEEFLK